MGQVVIVVILVMVLAAVPLASAPPTFRMVAWLTAGGQEVSEPTLVAVRATGQRIGAVSGVVATVLAVVLFVADVDIYLALVGYALAAVVGAAAPLGGGPRRRAELTTTRSPGPARLAGLGVGLAAVTSASALALGVQLARASGDRYGVMLTSSFGMPSVDLRHLVIVGSASAGVLVVSLLALVIVGRRQTAAGATPATDVMIRRWCAHRVHWGLVGAQLMLLGALAPAVQVVSLRSEVSYGLVGDQGLAAAGSAVGVALLAAGVVAAAVAVLVPVWVGPRHGMRPAAPRVVAGVGGR